MTDEEPRHPLQSKDVPATKGMLDAFRNEIKSEITSIHLKLGSHDKRFDSVDARFDGVDARFDASDARFDSVDKRFNSLENKMDARFDSIELRFDSRFEKLEAAIHRQTAIMEDSNANTRFALDGYRSLYDRQDRVEAKVERNEQLLIDLIKLRDK